MSAENGTTHLYSSNSLTSKIFAFYSCDLMFCWPRSNSRRSGSDSTRRHNDSTEWEGKASHIGLPMLLSQQAKKGYPVLAGLVKPHYQGEIALLVHGEGMEVQEIP
jgi:hypothetical protein